MPRVELLAQEGLAIHRKLGDLVGMAEGLGALSAVAYYSGDQVEAKRLCLETKRCMSNWEIR